MFVQIIQAKATDPAAVRRQFEKWRDELMPKAEGFLGSTGGVSADGEFITLARFESEEAARRNSDSSEQGEWWSETEKYLEDARFYDTTDVEVFMGGGSDDAGFVQVMQGTVQGGDENKERVRAMEAEMENLSSHRPDLIGGVTAWQGNDFSTFNYFTSEAEARANEKKEMPPEMQEGMKEWGELVGDMKFIDLTEPLMVTKQ